MLKAYYIRTDDWDLIVVTNERSLAVALFKDWMSLNRGIWIEDKDLELVAIVKSDIGGPADRVIGALEADPLWDSVRDYLERV